MNSFHTCCINATINCIKNSCKRKKETSMKLNRFSGLLLLSYCLSPSPAVGVVRNVSVSVETAGNSARNTELEQKRSNKYL